MIILGGLHVEMDGLKVIGNWLEDCGWVEALVQTKVASAGTRNYLKVQQPDMHIKLLLAACTSC